MNVREIQNALKHEGVDGWLFFDHHRRDPLAYRILRLSGSLQPTRRWYYYVPAVGEPRAVVHRVEPHMLDQLPGEKLVYSTWQEQGDRLRDLLHGGRRIAMQFSPDCSVPYISMIDGGTLDLVRKLGVEVLTSANLVQFFEARWSEEQLRSHLDAGVLMDRLRAEAFDYIRTAVRDQAPITEWDVRSYLLRRFGESGLETDHGPIVAVNGNASDPHYEPDATKHSPIRRGDFVLIDMWAKFQRPDAVFYDITWTGYCGSTIPDAMANVFAITAAARDKGVSAVQKHASERLPLHGWEVDDVVRGHIRSAGFGDYFVHRTGHSIGTNVHGAGANIDNFETHDDRLIIPRTCFSIEPGIYLKDFGVRSEVNVYVDEEGARVTGEIQRELLVVA